jgi:dTMP kinase
MSKLIVLEGLDSSGKSTQIEIIKKYFNKHNYKYEYIHFPIYDENESGKVISAYLRGEYGNLYTVDPIFIANMYAMNRFQYFPQLQKHLQHNDVVLLDRYVFSNMAYQGAKYDNEAQSNIIHEWIDEFEFGFLELPYPDLNIFFDIPIEFIEERLKNKREGEDRKYLNGKADIHEENIKFQEKVRQNYIMLKSYDHYHIVNCVFETTVNGSQVPLWKAYSPEDLFKQYENLLDKLMLIS